MSRVSSVRSSILLIAMSVLLSGCSIKMAYNNLDRLVRWGIADYVDLNSDQKEVLQREFKIVHAWHRRHHLPKYADFTRQLSVQWSDEVSPQNVADLFDQFEIWAGEVETRLTPLVIDIMVSLTDEQVAKLPERLAASNDEMAEGEADQSLRDNQAEWAEQFADGLKSFTGRLNRQQRDYLQRRSLEYQPERVLWADYRRRWQADLLRLLQQREDTETFAAGYRALVAQRESYYGPQLDAVNANNLRLNREVAAYLLSNLTPRQSQRFVERLQELGDDFSELARQQA